MDVVEIDPSRDVKDLTSRTGCSVILTFLAGLLPPALRRQRSDGVSAARPGRDWSPSSPAPAAASGARSRWRWQAAGADAGAAWAARGSHWRRRPALVAAAGGIASSCRPTSPTKTAVEDVFARAASELGGLDTAILAAGIGLFGPLETYPLRYWESTIATNLTGPFLCAKAAIPYLRQRGGGSIVAVSSGAGKQGYPQLAAYSASKFGLMGMMQGLAAEVAADGIKVCTVVPGSILTPFAGRTVAEKQAAMAKDPGKKYLEPEDVADAILFLLRQPKHAWTQELNLWPF